MAVLLFVLWILISGEITVRVCLLGAVVAAALSLFAYKVLGYSAAFDRRAVRNLGKTLGYLWYLLREILKAGFVVMKLIYTKGRHMEPRLIWFDTELGSDPARAALGDAITLTAGTITVSQEGGRMCVHTLDRPLADGLEHSEFEKRLTELERSV